MTRSSDRILPGVVLMLVFCVLAPLLDVSAKFASATIPVAQIVTARFLVQLLLMLPVLALMRLSPKMDLRLLGAVALRALFLILSTYSFVAAIAVMPLADALAVAFVEPFILLFLGHVLFKDAIGPRRIIASITGFIGALFVIQPSMAAFGLVALWPLGTAFFFAFYMLSTRSVSARMHPVAMQVHTSWIGALICLPILFVANGTGWPDFDPVMPQGSAWVALFGVGFWATVSHMCITYALKLAPASTLGPLHYFEIVMAVIFGYYFFDDFPDALTFVGIAIIVGSGLYVIYRERLTAREARQRAAAPQPKAASA